MIRRIFIGGAAALAAFTLSLASAATMGGLSPASLGADSGAVSSCDTDGVAASYGLTYDATTDKVYEIATVSVDGIADACDGKTLNITVTASDGSVLASKSTTIATSTDTSQALTLDTAVSAAGLANVHVAIS